MRKIVELDENGLPKADQYKGAGHNHPMPCAEKIFKVTKHRKIITLAPAPMC